MNLIQKKKLYQTIDEAIQKAKHTSRTVLVSYVQKIEQAIDPITFYVEARSNASYSVFWRDANHELTYAGINTAFVIEANGEQDSYTYVENRWQELLSQHILFPATTFPHGTGPILLGGFTFDPLKERGPLWKQFACAKFILPKYLLTKRKDEQWLTVNLWIEPTDTLETHEQCIQEADSLFIHGMGQKSQDKNEIESIRELAKDEWMQAVEHAATYVRDGFIKKLVLARELEVTARQSFAVGSILTNLAEEQPDSFIFAFSNTDNCFLGATPERLVKKLNDEIFSTCLAGSIKRGETSEEDNKLGETLLHDEKNLHEHEVVVEMIKAALEKHCVTVQTPEAPALYKVRDIQHLYTPVVGMIKKQSSLLKIVKELHPTPALGGYPKEEALQYIREIETFERGWYAAPVGWLDRNGNGEFAVAIRSGLIEDNKAYLFAGCGIVGNSDPESEYIETKIKFQPMLSAIGGLQNG